MTLECGSPLDVQVESTDTLPSRKNRYSLARVSGDIGLLQTSSPHSLHQLGNDFTSIESNFACHSIPTSHHTLKLHCRPSQPY